MGRTEFLTPTIRSEPRLDSANHHKSEMALFNECMQSCALIVLDTADIVRDGDLTPVDEIAYQLEPRITFGLPTIRKQSRLVQLEDYC